MSDDPFGLSGAGAAALSDDESASEEQAGSDDEQETTQAAVTEPAPAAPPAETQDAVTLGGEEDGAKKRKSGLLSLEEASAKLSTNTELRTFQPANKKQREDDPVARSIFSYIPEDGDLSEAKIGTDNARTLDVPFRTASYLLANNSKQRKAIEAATGTRIYVQNDPRDAKDKAPVKVTLVGDDTALNEAERRLIEANAQSARFVERVVHCKAFQAGAIIGKGGANIKRIQGISGVHMSISGNKGEAQTSDALRAVVLRGPPEAVEVAARLIHACLRSPAEMEAVFAELRGFGGDKAYQDYGDAAEYDAQWKAVPQESAAKVKPA